MKDVEFIVYKYIFNNGGYYYGRTRSDQNRLGNIEKYKGQYVYKVMKANPNFNIEIMCRTANPFVAYRVEYELIESGAEDVNCYNGATEEAWYQKVYKDISSKVLDYKTEDLLNDLMEVQNNG